MSFNPVRPVKEVSASDTWARKVLKYLGQDLTDKEEALCPLPSRQVRVFGEYSPVHNDRHGTIEIPEMAIKIPLRLRLGELDPYVFGIHLVDENLGKKTWKVLRYSYYSLIVGICRKGCTERRLRDIANQIAWMVIRSHQASPRGLVHSSSPVLERASV